MKSLRTPCLPFAVQGFKTVSTLPLANTAGSDYFVSSARDCMRRTSAMLLLLLLSFCADCGACCLLPLTV
jgi:hypothetical protein